MSAPALTGIVVHWRAPEALKRLLATRPRDRRFALVVVDNSGELDPASFPASLRLEQPGENLGFAGGVNRGLELVRSPLVLLLNPDVRPLPGAVEELHRVLEEHPDWPGAAPRLVGAGGEAQHAWQLRPLPSAPGLLSQTFFLPGVRRRPAEPAAGTPVEQPAAAALAIRRDVLREIGGMDPRFHPAWFEDVDLARRLAEHEARIRYWPRAELEHDLGSSLAALGYPSFLWIYYRNLVRYLEKHHGAGWAAAALACLPLAAAARALTLPLRRPRRAHSRGEALAGLATLALGAATGFRRPHRLARRFRRRSP